LRITISGSISYFTNTYFLNLAVVPDFLVTLTIGLFTPVFARRVRTLNPFLLPLAATQPVLIRYRRHQIDKHVIDLMAVITA